MRSPTSAPALALSLSLLPACFQPAPPASVVVASAAPAEAAAPVVGSPREASLATFAADLRRKCDAQPANDTTVGMKEAANKRRECKQAALAAVLSEAPPIEEALREPWTQHAELSCWMSEEARWVDLDAGTRDDGTLRGLTWLSCSEAVAVEVGVLARAFRRQDGAALAGWVRERTGQGQKAKAAVLELYRKVRQLQGKSPPSVKGGGTRLDAAAVSAYSTKLNRLAITPGLLGARTCAKVPSLAAALGGEKACSEQMELFYFAFGDYDGAP
jgi:hypothetical protein